MTSAFFERCNAFAQSWAWWLGRSILDAAIVLAVVSLAWLFIRRKAPPQLGYLLFLLVPLKLFVPLHISVPERFLSWAPRMAVRGIGQEEILTAPPSAMPVLEADDLRFREPMVEMPPLRETPTAMNTPPAAETRATAPMPRIEPTVRELTESKPVKRVDPSPLAWLMFAWFFGLLALVIRLLHAQSRFHQDIIRQAVAVDPARLPVDFAALIERLRLRRKIRVVESGDISSPVVCGIFRPMLILPAGFAASLSGKQIEWVLLHELAHIRRRDLAVNCFQRLAGILHFANPSIWIANRAIDRLREYACDDMASAYGGISQVDSGEAFLGVMRYAAAVQRRPDTRLEGALGMFELSVRASCFKRMARLLDANRRLSVKIRWGSLCLLLLIAAVALPQIRAAGSRPDKEKSNSATTSASIEGEKKEDKKPAGTEITAEKKEKPGSESGEKIAEKTEIKSEESIYQFSVIVAKHVNLLEGKRIVSWPEIESIIAKRPNPSQTRPQFYITRGAHEAGKYDSAKKEIWRLHQQYKLAGHSEGSLLPRADWRYDQIQLSDDLKADESLRVEGKVLGKDDLPAAGAEIVLVTAVDSSIPYKAYDIPLVEGRLRDTLAEVVVRADEAGHFAVYPPKDQDYYLVGLHPDLGICYVGRSQFTEKRVLHLLSWSGLVSEFGEAPEKQEADIRSHIAAANGLPEISFCQYWSDLKKDQLKRLFGFTHVPPIISTTISHSFAEQEGGSISLAGASVSLLPGETRRLDLGPLTEQQRQELERMRRDSEKRRKKAELEAKNSETSSDPAAWQPGQMLDFRAINAKTKEPLPDVKLELQFSGPGIDFGDVKIQTTDADGRSLIHLPNLRPDAVRVYPSKAGFVPLRVYWGDDLPSPKLPKSVTVPMEPGTVWGGVVRNEQGEPIPNVKVCVHYWERGKEFNPHLRANLCVEDTVVITDKDGRWQLDIMPANFGEEGPYLFLTHPDYVSDHLQRSITSMPITERPSYESLRDQTAVMVMRKGTTISGRVTDESGKPIAGALLCNDYGCYDPEPLRITATTDAEGRFRLAGLNHRQNYRNYFFTAQAAGYSPVYVEVSDNNARKPAEIKLKRGQSVQGQVLDENDKPLEGVSIKLDYWQGHPRQFRLMTATDADGKFRIDDAPEKNTEYDFEKPGYISVRKPLPPTGEDYRIALRPPIRIAGAILDAETNEPLAKCTLTKGWDPDNRAPEWETEIGMPAKEITDGRYEIKITQEQWFTRIRVEADGYMPAVSRLFKPYDPDRGLVAYDFKMKKAGPMTGTVLGVDGKPLADAEVFLAKHQFHAENSTASANARRLSKMAKTDAQGRFEFPPEVEPFYLITMHEQGHIVLDEKQFALTPTVRIEPWPSERRWFLLQRKQINYGGNAPENDPQTLNVRIVDPEGKPVEGADVASSAEFRAGYNYLGENEYAWDYFRNVNSDQDGRARVADQSRIDCVVARDVKRKLIAIQKITPEQVKSSETVTITLQPRCKVFGKLTAKELEAHGRKLEWSNVYACLPDGFARPMSCNSNKSEFHFYLPPGTYRLEGYATDTQNAQRTITVEPGQTELEVEPIDLPPIGLILLEGKPAPELREIVAWKNGGPVKLSDLKGKVVILAFSSHWTGQNTHDWTPNLFTICDKYRDRGLAIIDIRLDSGGITTQAELDAKLAEVKSPFWDDRDLPIPIALAFINRPHFLKTAEEKSDEKKIKGYWPCAILEDYGVGGYPAGVLIDRQGLVVGKFDLRSDRDNAVLEKLLKEKP